MHQGADQPGIMGMQTGHQIGTALGAQDLLLHPTEYLLNLLIEFSAVGDDQHPAVGHIFADPLGQPDHGQALAAALGVPDDAAIPAADICLGGTDAEILVMAAGFLGARIKHDKVVDQLQKARLTAQLRQMLVQQIGTRQIDMVGMDWIGWLFPLQIVFLVSFNGAVAHALSIVARHHQLHGGEEVTDKILLLVIQVLVDTFRDRDGRAFELNHAKGNAVDIEHQIRSFLMLALDRHLFGNGKVVGLRISPVNKPDSLVLLTCTHFFFHAITQQAIDLLVGVIEEAPFAETRRPIQLPEHLGDQRRVHSPPHQPSGQQFRLDISVVLPCMPIPQVAIAQLRLK